MSGKRYIAVPDRGFSKVSGTFPHGGIVRALIDFCTQSNGRRRECTQRTILVIQAAGHSGIAAAPSSAAVRGRFCGRRHDRSSASSAATCRAAFQIPTGQQIGGQPLTRTGHICHRTAKCRRNIGGVLAHISFVDVRAADYRHRLHAGRLAEAACGCVRFGVLKSQRRGSGQNGRCQKRQSQQFCRSRQRCNLRQELFHHRAFLSSCS